MCRHIFNLNSVAVIVKKAEIVNENCYFYASLAGTCRSIYLDFDTHLYLTYDDKQKTQAPL